MYNFVKLKYLFYFVIFISLLLTLSSYRYANHYEFIKPEDVWGVLVKETSKNLSTRNAAVCDYVSVFNDDSNVDIKMLNEMLIDTSTILNGGEYIPPNCKPLFSTAVIVPYRDRDKQLKDFLTYMHIFLKKQNIHYRIYVVEQDDVKPFNRAKLLNIGAVIAIHHGFPCIILHDVDLLPLSVKNIYACSKSPRHMSSTIDKFRFTLPYNELFGGVVSMLSEQFVAVNGMSNIYFGWGGEDDDLYERLQQVNLSPVRFDPSVSIYTMMEHKQQDPSPDRKILLAQAAQRYATDGLNSLTYTEKATKLHPLFTHIIVHL